MALVGCTVPQDAYTASKGAVLSLTKSLAVQYGSDKDSGERHLPWTGFDSADGDAVFQRGREEQAAQPHPACPVRRAEDVVWAGVFLASEESSWMTGRRS